MLLRRAGLSATAGLSSYNRMHKPTCCSAKYFRLAYIECARYSTNEQCLWRGLASFCVANKLATGIYVALPNITRSSVEFQVGYMELQLVITSVDTV